MSTQIYYFSGTGNSLHVARELKRRLGDTTLVPIISALNDDNLEATAEAVGLVFPIHAFNMPLTVQRFLQRLDLRSASYLFAIATRFCSDKVFDDIDRMLMAQGKALDATVALEMPCTYIPIFEIPEDKEIAVMESDLQRELDRIQAIIANRQASRLKDDPLVYALGHILYPPITGWYRRVRFPDMARSFYVTPECGGCGTCERVCLSGKIRFQDDNPEWSDAVECTYCFACLHFCPNQAIQMKNRKTTERARYHHAEIKARDITRQKQWGE